MASVPQRTFGASVMTLPSWSRGRRRSWHPLGSQEAGDAHEAQHPVLAHVELVLPSEVGPHLAVALAGEGAVDDHRLICSVRSSSLIWVFGPGRHPRASPRERR